MPCVAEVVKRSLKADCTDFTIKSITGKRVAYYYCNINKEFTVYDTTETNTETLMIYLQTKTEEAAAKQL